MENDMVVAAEVKYDLAIARAPKQVLAEAQDAAKALQSVVSKSTLKFNGKQYLSFEHWQTCGRFYGITAKIVSTEVIDIDGVKGFIAKAEAINTQTGAVVSAAESMCMNDEKNWSNKPLFQLRSMAQTRACAKALRNVLAWVVVLAGYEPSVAEEMTGDERGEGKPEIKPPQSRPSQADPFIFTFVPEAVDVRNGEKDGKPWTKYGIKAPDGRIFGTFDENHGNMAQDALQAKTEITVGFKTDKTGKYLNVITLTA